MKRRLIAFLFGIWLSLPFLAFAAGFQLGQQVKVQTMFPDARYAPLVTKTFLGTVVELTIELPELEPEIVGEVAGITSSPGETSGGDLFGMINDYRTSQGLAAFAKDDKLCEFAGTRLQQIQQRGSLDNHDGYNSGATAFMTQNRFTQTAENLAQGYSSAAATLAGWQGSLPHNSTLLTNSMDRACAAQDATFTVLLVGKHWNRISPLRLRGD